MAFYEFPVDFAIFLLYCLEYWIRNCTTCYWRNSSYRYKSAIHDIFVWLTGTYYWLYSLPQSGRSPGPEGRIIHCGLTFDTKLLFLARRVCCQGRGVSLSYWLVLLWERVEGPTNHLPIIKSHPIQSHPHPTQSISWNKLMSGIGRKVVNNYAELHVSLWP